MGTPEFAVPALRQLHAEFTVSTVVTIPDKPRGRGLTISPSEVKQAALDLGITDILQPEGLKDPFFAQQISERAADVICVIAFKILPRSVFSLSSKGTFNVHASLLPKFRGAAPINHAIIRGEQQTGVTSFLLNDKVDTGTVLLQRTCPVTDGMTAGDLYHALMPLAASCACDTTRGLLEGTLQPQPQDDTLATPAPKVYREHASIDWQQPRLEVRNFIHGYSPAPCAWSMWNGEMLKIYHASYSDADLQPGAWRMSETEFLVGCLDGAISIDELQIPGKRRMLAREMVAGYRGTREGTFE